MAPVEPADKRAMAFFDGQNLYRHAKDAFGHHYPNYDPIKLHAAVCAQQGWIPTLVRFYTGVPSPIHSPMWAPWWSNRILALKRAGVVTVTRPIRYHSESIENDDGTTREVVTPHEKGVDVRLALDVVSRARRKEFNVAVIYSQDQDICEVVEEIKEIAKEQDRWIKVACAYPHGPNATSNRGINGTDWIQMDEEFYNACLDQRDYRPKR